MKLLNVAMLAGLIAGMAQASDFTGVYGLVDRVVLEPNADHPERIQVFGVFAVATANDRNYYQPAQRGYLYFSLPANGRDQALREWADLKGVAGTHMAVAFGTRVSTTPPRVRKADEKPAGPDAYQTGNGMVKVRTDTDYAPIKSLLETH